MAKLLVSGASWTTGSASVEKGFNWTTQLNRKYGYDVINLAKDGASADYVTRSILTHCEKKDFDYVIAVFPVISSRREIITREDITKERLYSFQPIAGTGENMMINGMGDKRRQIYQNYQNYVSNDTEDKLNLMKNIIMLGQYLEKRNIKHIIIFDLISDIDSYNKFEGSPEVNDSYETFLKIVKQYISTNDYLSKYFPEKFLNDSLHPNDEGHKLLGDRFAYRLSKL